MKTKVLIINFTRVLLFISGCGKSSSGGGLGEVSSSSINAAFTSEKTTKSALRDILGIEFTSNGAITFFGININSSNMAISLNLLGNTQKLESKISVEYKG